MKKTSTIFNLLKTVAPSTCLLGASAGLVLGVSAGLFRVNYIDLGNADVRIAAANAHNYYDQDIKSEWNMTKAACPKDEKIDYTSGGEWEKLHWGKKTPLCTEEQYLAMEGDQPSGQAITSEALGNRWAYTSFIVDGAQHQAKDQSFNESVFQGLVNFCHNKTDGKISPEDEQKLVRKPAQDNNQAFQEQYLETILHQNVKVLGLPGFPHVAPLAGLGTYDEQEGLFKFNVASEEDQEKINTCAMIMFDGNMPNMQNVASVLFRADQPAFFTGLATCEYFLKNLETYHANYHDLSVGTYGGTQLNTVIIYMGGMQRGLEFFNEFILKNILLDARTYLTSGTESQYGDEYKKIIQCSKYKQELDDWKNLDVERQDELINSSTGAGLLHEEYSVRMVSLGNYDSYFTGSFTAGDGIGVSKQLLNRGASAILSVAGSQTVDSSQEVVNQKSNCFVIGVDTAQENGDAQRNGSYEDKTIAPDGSTSEQKGKTIRFSGIKDMVTVSEKIARLCMENKNWDVTDEAGGKPDPEKAICNIGFKTCGNLGNGLASISFDGLYFLMSALRHTKGLYGGQAKQFEDVWKIVVEDYCKEGSPHYAEIIDPIDFARNVNSWGPIQSSTDDADTGLLTFKKTYALPGGAAPTYLYRNYKHVTNILSEVLHDIVFDFNPNITVKMPYDPAVGPQKAEAPQTETIIEWLRSNMYFIN